MDIVKTTRKILDDFDEIRGKTVERFWDLVVLTASDIEQADAYEKQIELKKALHHLPLGVDYRVYYDPPGPKIGCGGSTMFVIDKLYSHFGEELWKKTVLLLNAGGQSQRLPSASVLGKIFTALPTGDPMYQLFDFKLACYTPFLEKMKPGFFHAPADTIEVYDLGSDLSQWSFDKPGFTALAHPSSLEIGRTHGVYLLEDTNENKPTSMRNCLEVLQKPSIERMRNKDAVLTKPDGEEFVYTDSCFYFDHSVSEKLLDFYQKHPVDCEIDSYGDFLQCLGPQATIDYTQDVKNVRTVDDNLVQTRIKIFHTLKNTPLHVLALEASKFYHFGTMKEYVENFCNDPVIATELGFQSSVFSALPEHMTAADDHGEPLEKQIKLSKQSTRECIMSSVLSGPGSRVNPGAVVEYCEFQVPVVIGEDSIISNCQLLKEEKSSNNCDEILIPSGTFMHTVWIDPVVEDGVPAAVTVVLGISDDVKKTRSRNDADKLAWIGMPLLSVTNALEMKLKDIFEQQDKCSLWTAKLFPVCSSMSQSFQVSYNLLQCALKKERFPELKKLKLVSMEDIVKRKNVARMLEFRKDLYHTILSKQSQMTKYNN